MRISSNGLGVDVAQTAADVQAQINSAISGVADMVPATPDDVQGWYRTYVAYDGDLQSIAYWAERSITIGRADALVEFLDALTQKTSDHRNIVKNWYAKYAGYAADEQGLAYWSSMIPASGIALTLSNFLGQVEGNRTSPTPSAITTGTGPSVYLIGAVALAIIAFLYLRRKK